MILAGDSKFPGKKSLNLNLSLSDSVFSISGPRVYLLLKMLIGRTICLYYSAHWLVDPPRKPAVGAGAYFKIRKPKMPSKNPDSERAPSYVLRPDPNMAFSHPNPAAPRSLGTYRSPNRTGPESEPNREELGEEKEEEEEVELEKLESEVKEMARKILDYRATLPDQIKSTFISLLSAQRPLLPDFDTTSFYPGQPSSAAASGSAGQISKSGEAPVLSDEERKTTEKACLLKDKIASNVSAVPAVLKRMKECISKIDKLDPSNGIIPPAFKRKKTG